MSSFDTFPILHLRALYVSNAIQGIGFSILLSFIILIITSMNLYISLIAVTHILLIILTLLSMINFYGWSLGLIESTCVIVFVGISFDYVVHICHSYNHSLYQTRKKRMDFAYAQMGQTIFSGALTTSFSGVFLILCETDTLYKFGILLLTTIVSAIVIALVLLPAQLYLFGPE